ncbi:hypothetical protein I203_108504 [Kwoniella mangroviensis CBS 8507]|uniref:hypothetical protein n=1 Tax=Kwoniella mangroviensis CBS 8507 TaxID=1296122 RepID=UPI00080D0BFF|nr:uncharacterized protein I203_05400 [Kwoniella mangroviensis CBS 8507]OCF65719.1 hypothetical protein I203_05400 [Kwoniella mangroviensis CBS 8507]
MKSLFSNLTKRTNSQSNTPTDDQSQSHISSTGAPLLPPISTGVLFLPTSSTPSVPIPTSTSERWVRPTLPSYAVSRAVDANADLPEYQDAVAVGPSSNNDDGILNRAAAEYFGTSSNSHTDEPSRLTSASPTEEFALDISEDNGPSLEVEEDDDDPLIPRRRILDSHEHGQSYRRNTFSVFEASHQRPTVSSNLSTSLDNRNGFVDLPIPTSEPPIYSPSLGRDELRLISTVHLSADHPASAYFNAIAQSPPPPAGPSSSSNVAGGDSDISTGGKKLKLTLTRGGRRMNANGTGPLYIKLGREDWVEGRIEVGKVDRAVGLEVAIIGMINVSYYVRGQYTVLDTLPMARNKIQLFPKTSSSDETSANRQVQPPTTSSNDNQSNPDTPGLDDPPEPSTSSSTTNLLTPSTKPLFTKDGLPMIPPNTSFRFSLQMPTCHYKDTNSELPSSCDLQQVGMQANVEYVLRVKLIRKGLRFNETITVPIIYDPRAYITPRRIRALTSDDPLNPGWHTVGLNGGKPKIKTSLIIPAGAEGPGIEVNLLIPSPPILFLPSSGQLPSFPFHLHFHSTLPHVLSTFSNPRESKFVIRLTRVTIFRIGIEREIRRIEIPTRAEVWQEGGERIMLGVEGMMNDENNRRRGSTASTVDRRDSISNDTAHGLSSSVPTSSNMVEGGPLRRFSSAGSTTTTDHVNTNTRRKSLLGDRRGSLSGLMKRRGSNSSQTPTGTLSSSPITSNLPPTIDEDQIHHPQNDNGDSSIGMVPVDMTSTEVHLKGLISLRPFSISSASSDDRRGTELLRKLMVQSFIVPEMTLTYVLEIGIEPRRGSVKENFGHVWGGGVIEVVWGR